MQQMKPTASLRIYVPQGSAIVVCSLPMKSRKGLERYAVTYTVAAYADIVHDVKYTESQTQNGSAHAFVFRDF